MCVCAAQLHGLDRVHQLLVAEEQRRGQLYVRVVVSRLDHVWLAAHPPLSLLTATCAWVPRAEDYGGLNDRHAVLSREHADAYLGRWQMISSGRIMKLHPKLKLGIANGLTGERTLAAIMDALGIRVCRFAPVSFLACCAPAIDVQQNSSTGGGIVSRVPRRCHNPRCTRLRVPLTGLPGGTSSGAPVAKRTSIGPLDVRGKYTGELRAAVLHALALRLPGSRWALRQQREPRPNTTAGMIPSLAVIAHAEFRGHFNASLRRALRGRGMSQPLILWEAQASLPAPAPQARRLQHAAEIDAHELPIGASMRGQQCLLTLARDVPRSSLEALAAQSWYSSFRHIFFHEDSRADNATRRRYADVHFVHVGAYFAKRAGRARLPIDGAICATDRATTLRYPPSYRTMCAFWFADVFLRFAETRACEFALRIDGDCVLEPGQPDPLLALPRAVSSPFWQGMDSPWVIRGLARFFEQLDHRRHLNEQAAPLQSAIPNLTTHWRVWRSPYTNVMMLNVTWVREQRPIFAAVANTNCIYSARWGDLPLWGATLHLSRLPAQHLNLSYTHGSHRMRVGGSRGRRRSANIPQPWLSPRANALQPELLPWRDACAEVGRMMPRPPNASSSWRIRTLAAALTGQQLPHQRAPTPPGVRVSPALLERALRSAIDQLRVDLKARGILCSETAPCTVSVLADGRRLDYVADGRWLGHVADRRRHGGRYDGDSDGEPSPHSPSLAASLLVRICLPNATLTARLCEPFAERAADQIGMPIGSEAGTCFDFDVREMARWWTATRMSAPLVSPGSTVEHDSAAGSLRSGRGRFAALLRAKGALSSPAAADRYSRELEVALRAISDAERVNRPQTSGKRSGRGGTRHQTKMARCAVVGSGHDLHCGGMHGEAIDSASGVFRFDASQHFGLANNMLGHMLRRLRTDARHAGRRTTHRVRHCMHANGVPRPPERGTTMCVVSRQWWLARWGDEYVDDTLRPCCEKPVRSSYNLSRLLALTDLGYSLAWFDGHPSNDSSIEQLRKSAEGEALLTALGLCEHVELYGVGLLRVGSLGSELVDSHFYDRQVGRCVGTQAGQGPTVRRGATTQTLKRAAMRSRTRRVQQVRKELLLHVWHSFGVLDWIQ